MATRLPSNDLAAEREIARLERENADKQERINRAVRDLDHIAFRLSQWPQVASQREFVLEAQSRLRGK